MAVGAQLVPPGRGGATCSALRALAIRVKPQPAPQRSKSQRTTAACSGLICRVTYCRLGRPSGPGAETSTLS